MSSYEAWREFAAHWGLLYFGLLFVVTVGYALLPARKKSLDEAARIPLRED